MNSFDSATRFAFNSPDQNYYIIRNYLKRSAEKPRTYIKIYEHHTASSYVNQDYTVFWYISSSQSSQKYNEKVLSIFWKTKNKDCPCQQCPALHDAKIVTLCENLKC
jgi:hypothetical protein